MGDRGNCIIYTESDRDPIVFYTHWRGSALPRATRKAIADHADRWGDPSYLARIVFEAIRGEHADTVLGLGISTRVGDNEHPLTVVDIPRAVVFSIDSETMHGGVGELPAWSEIARPLECGGVNLESFEDCRDRLEGEAVDEAEASARAAREAELTERRKARALEARGMRVLEASAALAAGACPHTQRYVRRGMPCVACGAEAE